MLPRYRAWSEVRDLSTAYLYTGKTRYVYNASVLLDRIADLHPDMDYATSPSYDGIWVSRLGAIAALLHKRRDVAGRDLYGEFPKLRQNFRVGGRFEIDNVR